VFYIHSTYAYNYVVVCI